MSKHDTAGRRSFLKRGAFLAAPLAAGTPAFVLAADGAKARLRRLEDEAALRELHQRWLGEINAGGRDAILGEAVRRVSTDHAEPDLIEIAANGKNATGRFHCTVELEAPLAADSTLAQMAHAQGTGFIRRKERRVLEVEYAKSAAGWSIQRATLG
jgi:hypothetical protein